MTTQMLDIVDAGGPSRSRRGVSVTVAVLLVVAVFAGGIASRTLVTPTAGVARPRTASPDATGAPVPPRAVPRVVNMHLDEIQEVGRQVLGTDDLTIEVDAVVEPYDFRPGVTGHVVTVPGKPAQNDRDAQILAWFGVMEILFQDKIAAALPYDESAVRCFDAFRALNAPRATTVLSVGRGPRAFWIEEYVGRTIGASDVVVVGDPAATFTEYVASMLTVLRYYPAQVAKRLARLSPSDRRALLTFERSVTDALGGDAWNVLHDAIPSLVGPPTVG
jgi:hypothetical protein